MDVVEASPEFWSVEPFAGAVRDGYIYGRGALDMKGQGIAELMAFVLLRRSGTPLRRDVILLATADEEVGGGVGAGWVVREHPELVRGAEFLINEGGSMRRDEAGGVRYVGVGVTEKAPLWLQVTSRGTAGHGSRPTQDNAVERLIRALARLEAYETPYVVTPAADRFFRDLGTREMDPSRRAWFADIARAVQDSAARRFLESDLYYNAVLRNTISVTRLAGSGKVNVIPPVARAEVDVRLLPGEEPQRFLAQLRRVVGDTLVSVEPQGVSWPATESPTDNALFRAIEEVSEQHFPGVLVTTPMLAGFTDSHLFRRLGIVSYGIEPFPVSEQESRGVHGNDERLSLRDLEFGTRYLFEILLRVAGR
jgi:acetylornithine deacetylase/succinyl-diaminopimelate desuccinylase-like protein